MPLSDRIWSGEAATSYFDGLLPDDRTVREKIAAREHADSAGIFDLLAVIGRDCVGALRFVPEGLDPGDPSKIENRPVSDDAIAEVTTRAASAGMPEAISGPILNGVSKRAAMIAYRKHKRPFPRSRKVSKRLKWCTRAPRDACWAA